jgi:hypothetical protein
MSKEGTSIREMELAARLAEDPGLAARVSSMTHRHMFRLIEAPEFTSLLQQRTEYQPAALERVSGGYFCEGCGSLGSLVYRGAQHPVHYLSSGSAL